jgi:hypothetical protein
MYALGYLSSRGTLLLTLKIISFFGCYAMTSANQRLLPPNFRLSYSFHKCSLSLEAPRFLFRNLSPQANHEKSILKLLDYSSFKLQFNKLAAFFSS